MYRSLAIAAALALPSAAIAAAPMSGAMFVKKAGAGDLYEITSSKLVMNSTNPQVKDFATKMVSDHEQSTADVKAAAMQAGMKVAPPMMDAAQSKMIAALKAKSGSARDMLYIQQQKQAHQMALTLHQGYAADGTVAPLKMAAAKIAPVVQSHIDMLNGMPMSAM